MTSRKSILMVLTLGLLWAAADQATKYLAVRDLTTLFPAEAPLAERLDLFYGTDGLYPLAKRPAEILGPVWQHRYVQNPAGAFGLLNDAPLPVRRGVFTVVALVAALGILWMARGIRGPGATLTRLALALVFGGALGNLTDRIIHGYVIDFIDWHWKSHHWPAFNLADVGIVVGVFGLLILLNRVPAASDEAVGEAT